MTKILNSWLKGRMVSSTYTRDVSFTMFVQMGFAPKVTFAPKVWCLLLKYLLYFTFIYVAMISFSIDKLLYFSLSSYRSSSENSTSTGIYSLGSAFHLIDSSKSILFALQI